MEKPLSSTVGFPLRNPVVPSADIKGRLQKVRAIHHDLTVLQKAGVETPMFPSKHSNIPGTYHQYGVAVLEFVPSLRFLILISPLLSLAVCRIMGWDEQGFITQQQTACSPRV